MTTTNTINASQSSMLGSLVEKVQDSVFALFALVQRVISAVWNCFTCGFFQSALPSTVMHVTTPLPNPQVPSPALNPATQTALTGQVAAVTPLCSPPAPITSTTPLVPSAETTEVSQNVASANPVEEEVSLTPRATVPKTTKPVQQAPSVPLHLSISPRHIPLPVDEDSSEDTDSCDGDDELETISAHQVSGGAIGGSNLVIDPLKTLVSISEAETATTTVLIDTFSDTGTMIFSGGLGTGNTSPRIVLVSVLHGSSLVGSRAGLGSSELSGSNAATTELGSQPTTNPSLNSNSVEGTENESSSEEEDLSGDAGLGVSDKTTTELGSQPTTTPDLNPNNVQGVENERSSEEEDLSGDAGLGASDKTTTELGSQTTTTPALNPNNVQGAENESTSEEEDLSGDAGLGASDKTTTELESPMTTSSTPAPEKTDPVPVLNEQSEVEKTFEEIKDKFRSFFS